MLIRQTLLYMPAQLLGPLFQFIAAVVWTHYLLPDAYGVLAFLQAGQELAFLFCLSWWSSYTLRFVSTFDDAEGRRRYQRTENAILCLTSLAQAAITVLILVRLDAPLTTHLVAIAIVFTATRSVTNHLIERARARGQIVAYSIAQIVAPCLGFALAWLAIVLVAPTPEMALAGFALAQVAGILFLWHAMELRLVFGWPDTIIFKRAIVFGMPLVGSGVIAWVSVNGIRVIVERGGGLAAVGLISVGWGLGQRLASTIAMVLTAAAFPLAVKRLQAGDRADALRQLALGGTMLFGLLAPSAAGIFLLADDVVAIMVAAPFREVTSAVLPIAALAGAVRNIRVHFSDQAFILFERTRFTLIINGIEAVCVVVCCAAGMHVGGLAGASIGALAGSTIGTLFGFASARALFGLPIPLDNAARILGATAVMMGAARYVPTNASPVIHAVAVTSVAILVYAAALACFYPALTRSMVRRLRATVAVRAAASIVDGG